MAIQKTVKKPETQTAPKPETMEQNQNKASVRKMDPEDLENLQKLQTETDRLIYNLGQVWVQKEKTQSTENELRKKLKSLESKEAELGKQLSSKYGVGTVDITSGTFTSKNQ